MGRIRKAFKFQMDNKFNLFKTHDIKALLINVLLRLLVFIGIVAGVYYLCGSMFTMLSLKVKEPFLAIVLVGCQAVSFVFGIANVISTLYMSKDNELLMVLPISFNEIFISKILVLYVSELLFSLNYLFPIFVSLGLLGSLNGLYYLTALLLMPILPIFPIALASILSIPVMTIVRFLKKHLVLSVMVLLSIVVGVFVGYMEIVTNMSGAFNIAEKQIESSLKINQNITKLGSSIWGYFHIAESLCDISLFYRALLFLAGSLTLFCACFLLIRPLYFRIATMTTENSSRARKKAKKFKKYTPFQSLLLNEIRSVFRSPGYLFQYFLFPLLMPLIVYTYDKLLVSIVVNQAGKNMIIGAHVLVLSIVALMSNTISSTAISREGGTFYIAKCTPVSFYEQVKAKIAFNAIFTMGAIFITTILTLVLTDYGAITVIGSGVCVSVMAFGHICHSFDMDLRNPVLDWYDNSEITSISKSTTVCILYALLLSVLSCVIVILTASSNMLIAFVVLFIVSALYCAARVYLLALRTKYYYEKMEI